MTTHVGEDVMTETDLLGLKGKVALVIGGGRGLGEASALTLAGAGAHVAVVDIDEAAAVRVRDQVTEAGVQAMSITADVLDPAQVGRVIAETEAGLGGLDILVTIVGGSKL